MPVIDESHAQRLIQIESEIHYGELPPPGVEPFVCISRKSPVILSAPHGARTFRNNATEIWHEEDEYTAGMALLLSELCQTSIIATIWRTEESDPNEHGESRSAYKQALRRLIESDVPKPTWLLDLHGASEDTTRLATTQKVDLGKGRRSDYLPVTVAQTLEETLEKYLGKGCANRNGKPGWDAENEHRMAAFAHCTLDFSAVQIEMKPSVRIPLRRIDASMYAKAGPYPVNPSDVNVIGMMQALVDFIEHLKTLPVSS